MTDDSSTSRAKLEEAESLEFGAGVTMLHAVYAMPPAAETAR